MATDKGILLVLIIISLLVGCLQGTTTTPEPGQSGATSTTIPAKETSTPRPVKTIQPETTTSRPTPAPTTTSKASPTSTQPPQTTTTTSSTSTTTTITTTTTSTTTTTTSTSTTTSTTATTQPVSAPVITPVPDGMPLESYLRKYMVDIEGYSKGNVGPSQYNFFEMGAKYSKGFGKTVVVELNKFSSNGEAVNWVMDVTFANSTESRFWEPGEFMGLTSNYKVKEYSVSDRKGEDIFIRIAAGNLGVFVYFKQEVGQYEKLTPVEEAQVMVNEVATAIIKALETL